MKRDYIISVAMATYNGEKYIKEQLESILKQLNDDDEVIISDDGSTDNTINIIKSFEDKRIKVFDGPHNGVKQNFANAIYNCTGKYIFLSDQDDVWMKNKINKILEVFEKEGCTCVVHDNITFDSNTGKTIQESFFKFRNSKSGIIKNIIKNSYIGCCMAFKGNLKKDILPIPNDIEMHDQWIGLICEKEGKSLFINDKLIRYRRHNNNVSNMKHYSIIRMMNNRIKIIKEIIKR